VLPGDEQMLMTRFDPEVGGIVLALDLATGEMTEIVQGSDPTYPRPVTSSGGRATVR